MACGILVPSPGIKHGCLELVAWSVLTTGPPGNSNNLSCIYLWLCWVFVAPRTLSLVATSRGHILVVGLGLLIAVASLVVEHRFQSEQASGVAACGIFPDQGPNLCLLHWQADSSPLSQQRSPQQLKCLTDRTYAKHCVKHCCVIPHKLSPFHR